MKIAVLGTGEVGRTLATKLVALGHEVCMGSRTADHEGAAAWAAEAGANASHGTFRDAATDAELVLNCTRGTASLDALHAAGADALAGKLLWDLSNPLDFSNGFPPSLTTCNTDSLAEQLQRAFPNTRIVKTLNTMANPVMVDPARVSGAHTVFICGNDAEARATTAALLADWFGWQDILDLGDLSAARGTEAFLLLWVRLWGTLGTSDFNVQIVRNG